MMDFGGADEFGNWGDELPVAADRVVRRWWHILMDAAPWRMMPVDDGLGSMRRVMSELLNEGGDLDRGARHLRLTSAARDHGAFRRAQRCSLEDLSCEFGLLLDALDGEMRHAGMTSAVVRDILTVLDSEFCLAQEAAARGWNRGVFIGATVNRRVSGHFDDLD
jgi:hypothetical protein